MYHKKNFLQGLSKDSFLIAFASFFADISTEMLYPILPIFLTQTLKASANIVGIVEGVAEATQNIIQVFSGRLSDRIQNRKTIAMIGYAIAAISKPIIGFATIWQIVLGTRFIDRLGTGIRSAPRDALIASSSEEADRGKAFGLEGVGDNLGAFIGPILAIILIFIIGMNIRIIFYLAFIPGIIAFVMIMLAKEKKVDVQSKAKLDLSFKQFPKTYWKYILVTLLFGIGNSSNSFLILKARSIGVSLIVTILIYAIFNLVAAMISYPSGYFADKWGRKNILLISFVIFLITYAGFAFSKNVLLIGLLFILYGLYQGTFRSVGRTFATDFVSPNLRASCIGWYSMVIGISSLIASVIGGQLWVSINSSATFVYGAVFALVGIISLILLIPEISVNYSAE